MPDRPAPVPPDLHQARIGLLSALAALVRYARTLDEGPGRDGVRHVIRAMTNTIVMIYPPTVADAAQTHALQTLEIQHPHAGRVEISGETMELWAAELCKWFLAHGEEQSA